MTSSPLDRELADLWHQAASDGRAAIGLAAMRRLQDRLTGPAPALAMGPGFVVHRVAEAQLRGVAGSVRARIYWPMPAGDSSRPGLLVFLPAGGFFPAGIDRADTVCRALCARAGVVVLSVSYRPLPANPYPAAFQDATMATEWAADHGGELGADAGRLVVAGESAGGSLAAAVALHARDHQWPLLARQLLIYPSLDARLESPSCTEHANAPLNSVAMMRWFYQNYLPAGQTGTDDGYPSPLTAPSVTGLAPATIVTVDHDPLRDDGRRYAARLRRAGVEVEEWRYPGLAHGTLSLLGRIGAAERMLTDLAHSLRRVLHRPAIEGSTPANDRQQPALEDAP